MPDPVARRKTFGIVARTPREIQPQAFTLVIKKKKADLRSAVGGKSVCVFDCRESAICLGIQHHVG